MNSKMQRYSTCVVGLLVGTLLVAMAPFPEAWGDFNCQLGNNCQCKMVQGYAQINAGTKPPAAWTFWTFVTDEEGQRFYTAAENASGNGGLQTCDCPLPDNGGTPKQTNPVVTIQRYQLGSSDSYWTLCPVPTPTAGFVFAEIGAYEPPQNAALANWTQYTCQVGG